MALQHLLGQEHESQLPYVPAAKTIVLYVWLILLRVNLPLRHKTIGLC
jgi:hypothetical protein